MELKINWIYKRRSFLLFFKRIFLLFPFIRISPFLHTHISFLNLLHYIALDDRTFLISSTLTLSLNK